MELLQLRYFLHLSKNLHVTRTADELHISQPSLSATMKKLEAELDAPLFIRKGRGIELTEFGRMFAQYAERALLELENGAQAVRSLKRQQAGQLSLGLLSPYIWTDIFREFSRLHPEIQVNRLSVEDSRFADSLREGKIDLYMGGINQIEDPARDELQLKMLYEDDMVLLMPLSHPFAGKASIDLRDCRDEAFIGLDPGTNLQQFINSLFRAAGFMPHTVMTCDYTLRDQMVAEGHGVSITTRIGALKTTSRGICFAPLSFPREKRRLGLVWQKKRLLTDPMKKFMDHAAAFYRNNRPI